MFLSYVLLIMRGCIVGRPAEALPLWQGLFDMRDPFFDPGNLIDCQARLHRDDLVMQTCDQLHARGVVGWPLLEFEISYLEKYNIGTAVERLQAFIEQHPDHNLAKLRLSLIGLRVGRPELVRSELKNIPSVEDLPLDYVMRAVQVMKYGGNPNAAVDYAYRFLRLHFNDVDAHQAMIASMMPDSSSSDIPPALDVVVPNAAVCYREGAQGADTWVVLEDTDKPSGDFEEISLTSSRAVALLGKRVGDTAVIAKGSVQDRWVTIIQILPKYVRRYQDSFGEMQLRFGAASNIESIQIEQPEDGDPKKSLSLIFASVEKRAAAIAGVREAYNTLPASLHWYGTRFGKNAYVAVMDLAQEEGQRIKCCVGSSGEREQALQFLETARGIIVDLTALATLRLLDLEKILSSTKFHFVISERSLLTLQEMLFNARIFSGPGGAMIFKKGQHILYEETGAEKEERNRKDEQFIEFLKKATEVRSAPRLAAVEPTKRESLEKFFGLYGAESIVLSSDPDYVLWTDDFMQAQMAAQEFGCHRVWTQLVLGSLTQAGLVTADEYNEGSAKLVGMEFVATQFDGSSMLSAFRLAGWSSEKNPATEIMKIFSDPGADLQALFRIHVDFLKRLYQESLTQETKCSVTRALLEAFARKDGAMMLLESLRRLSSQVFSLNEIGRAQFDSCFDRWLKYRATPIIHLP